MNGMFRYVFVLGVVLLVLTGCYNTPVQHLASDAALVKSGKSTRQEVLLLLGEPDAQRALSENTQEWIYYEEQMSLMQRTPVVGELFDAEGYGMIRIVLQGDLVISCNYSSFDSDEFDWSEDYSWQEAR